MIAAAAGLGLSECRHSEAETVTRERVTGHHWLIAEREGAFSLGRKSLNIMSFRPTGEI